MRLEFPREGVFFLREKSLLHVALRPLSGSPTRDWSVRTIIHSFNKHLLTWGFLGG